MCFDFSNILSETFLILRTTQQDIIINAQRSSCKVQLFLSDLKQTSIFCTEFGKNSQISNCMKMCPVEVEMLHADGKTDRQT